MAKTDPALGQRVHEHLVKLGLENPVDFGIRKKSSAPLAIETGFNSVCENLGLTNHPSTRDTGHRLAKMFFQELTWGLDYDNFPKIQASPNDGGVLDEILLERNIEVKSLCEHHFMPVIGHAHVAVLTGDKLLGLSKYNRIVQFFARRPQLQERMGQQILATLKFILGTEDVAVIITAEHYCVKFRGVEDGCSDTVTSHMSGRFRTDMMARQELLTLVKGV